VWGTGRFHKCQYSGTMRGTQKREKSLENAPQGRGNTPLIENQHKFGVTQSMERESLPSERQTVREKKNAKRLKKTLS